MPDQLGNMRRTHHCGELGADDVDKEVVLMGWVHRRRDHGGVIFVDLRDRVAMPRVDQMRRAEAERYLAARRAGQRFVEGRDRLVLT